MLNKCSWGGLKRAEGGRQRYRGDRSRKEAVTEVEKEEMDE